MTTPLRAALYARISRDMTGEGLGVERQLVDCRRKAADKGWTVADEYVDNDISAYAGKRRPSYERMLNDIAAGEVDAVIVYNTDRLTRRPIELEEFTAVCASANLTEFVTVSGDINLGNDDGMFVARVLAAFAAKESARKSARQRSKAEELARAGAPNGGVRPFGYEKDQLTVRESEAEVIRQLADRYLAGESSASLTRWLQEAEIPTAQGAPWRSSTIRQILTSARIAGQRTHRGEVVGTAQWPAIITPEMQRQLVARFSLKTPTTRRTPRRYLLSGMLRCGKCGHKLFSSARKDSRRYVCISGPDHDGCGRLTIVAGPVELWIQEAVLMRIDSPAMHDALAGRVAEDDRHNELLAQLQNDQSQMEELANMWANKTISSAEWSAARAPIEGRITTTNRQLMSIASNASLDGIIGRGDALRTSWESLNLTRQAAIVGAILDHATIAPGAGGGRREVDPNRIVPTWRL